MIIAKISMDGVTFDPPKPPMMLSPTDVEALNYSGPFTADDYIFTRCALPHQDLYLSDKYFVTMSLVDGFEIGDVKARNASRASFINQNSFRLYAGDIFIVDPRTTHWLVPANSEVGPDSKVWVGLQWVVERRKLTQTVKKIVAELGARSVGCEDRRYARMLAKVFP